MNMLLTIVGILLIIGSVTALSFTENKYLSMVLFGAFIGGWLLFGGALSGG